jgi:hypothetical protein
MDASNVLVEVSRGYSTSKHNQTNVYFRFNLWCSRLLQLVTYFLIWTRSEPNQKLCVRDKQLS